MSVPALCPRCGCAISSGVRITNSRDVTLGAGQARCHCGGTARAVEGIFDFDDDGMVVRVIEASQHDRELLRRVGLLIDELLDQGAEPDAVIAEVERISPAVAAALPTSPDRLRKVATTIASMLLSGAVGVGMQTVWDARHPPAQPPAVTVNVEPPQGSEGEVTVAPNGWVIRWAPGTRPDSAEGRGTRGGPAPR